MNGDTYTVTIDGPDGMQVRRIFAGVEVRSAAFGPEQPHAKAALMASLMIQAQFERGELGVGDRLE